MNYRVEFYEYDRCILNGMQYSDFTVKIMMASGIITVKIMMASGIIIIIIIIIFHQHEKEPIIDCRSMLLGNIYNQVHNLQVG